MDLTMLEAGGNALLGAMRKRGYSERHVRCFESMIRFALENNCDEWTCFQDVLDAYSLIHPSKDSVRQASTVLFGIERFCIKGEPPGDGFRRRYPERTCYGQLNGTYRRIIDGFVATETGRGAKKSTTISSEASCAASFLLAMQASGHACLADVTEESVLGFLVADGTPTRSKSYLKSVRAVLASHAKAGGPDASKVLALIPRPLVRTMPAAGLSDDEFSAFLGVLRGGGVSLRDRAIGLLLASYGLRRSDVSGLRLSDVDLGASVIRVTQRKTGAPVELPLLPEVGNALCDYVRFERPKCDNPYVFQSLSRPYGRLSPCGVYCVTTRLLDRAGVARRDGEPRGTHAFRHRVATELLGDEAPQPVVSGVLGHEDPRSVEAYVSADVEHLRSCALSIGAWPIPEGVFAT